MITVFQKYAFQGFALISRALAVLVFLLACGCGKPQAEKTASAPGSPKKKSTADETLEKGILTLTQNQYQLAVVFLENAAVAMPNNQSASYNLGIAYWKLGRLQQAADAFEKSAKLSTTDARPYEFLGYILGKMGKWDDARSALRKALSISKDSPQILTSLAVVECGKGDNDSAFSHLNQAILHNSDYAPALYNLALLYKDIKNNKTLAAEYFRKYIQITDDTNRAAKASAFLASLEKGKKKSAKISPDLMPAIAQTPVAEQPAQPEPDENKNTTAQTIAQPPAALQQEAKPSPAEPLIKEANNAINERSFDKATVLFKEAMAKDADNPEALWGLILLYRDHLDYNDMAQNFYLKFKQKFPSDPRTKKNSIN